MLIVGKGETTAIVDGVITSIEHRTMATKLGSRGDVVATKQYFEVTLEVDT